MRKNIKERLKKSKTKIRANKKKTKKQGGSLLWETHSILQDQDLGKTEVSQLIVSKPNQLMYLTMLNGTGTHMHFINHEGAKIREPLLITERSLVKPGIVKIKIARESCSGKE